MNTIRVTLFENKGESCSYFNLSAPSILENEYKLNVFPNPSSIGEITISYQLNKYSDVKFKIMDYTGRNVMVLNNEKKSAGIYAEQVNISQLAAGVYLLITNINGEYQTIKLIKL